MACLWVAATVIAGSVRGDELRTGREERGDRGRTLRQREPRRLCVSMENIQKINGYLWAGMADTDENFQRGPTGKPRKLADRHGSAAAVVA